VASFHHRWDFSSSPVQGGISLFPAGPELPVIMSAQVIDLDTAPSKVQLQCKLDGARPTELV